MGKSGESPLICFGINPSCAHLEKVNDVWIAKPDSTMCRVRNVSAKLGFDGYIMLNLYPLIDKNPDILRKIDNNQLMDLVCNKLYKLVDLKVGYLSLQRSIPSLSGGEVQRIRIATQLTCSLKGLLYILDEPCKGLHASELIVDKCRMWIQVKAPRIM